MGLIDGKWGTTVSSVGCVLTKDSYNLIPCPCPCCVVQLQCPVSRLALPELHPLVGRNVAGLGGGMLIKSKYSFAAVWMCADLVDLQVIVTAHAIHIFAVSDGTG